MYIVSHLSIQTAYFITKRIMKITRLPPNDPSGDTGSASEPPASRQKGKQMECHIHQVQPSRLSSQDIFSFFMFLCEMVYPQYLLDFGSLAGHRRKSGSKVAPLFPQHETKFPGLGTWTGPQASIHGLAPRQLGSIRALPTPWPPRKTPLRVPLQRKALYGINLA